MNPSKLEHVRMISARIPFATLTFKGMRIVMLRLYGFRGCSSMMSNFLVAYAPACNP